MQKFTQIQSKNQNNYLLAFMIVLPAFWHSQSRRALTDVCVD